MLIYIKGTGFADINWLYQSLKREGVTEIIWLKFENEVWIRLTWHSMSGCGSGWAAVKSLDDKEITSDKTAHHITFHLTSKLTRRHRPIDWSVRHGWSHISQSSFQTKQEDSGGKLHGSKEQRHSHLISEKIYIWDKTMLQVMHPKVSGQIPHVYINCEPMKSVMCSWGCF